MPALDIDLVGILCIVRESQIAMVFPVSSSITLEISEEKRTEYPLSQEVRAPSLAENVEVRTFMHQIQQAVHGQAVPEPEQDELGAGRAEGCEEGRRRTNPRCEVTTASEITSGRFRDRDGSRPGRIP